MNLEMEKPTPPAPHECCGGGSCCPCVWDRYYDELAAWRERESAAKQAIAADVVEAAEQIP